MDSGMKVLQRDGFELIAPLPSDATRLIERNTRNHTVDGYTSYPALAGAHESTIRALCAELSILQARNLQCMPGTRHATMMLGAASVLVEYETQDEEARTYEHPGSPASVAVLRAFINGHWCDAGDVIPKSVIERWECDLLEGRADAAEAAAENAADAAREFMRDLCPVPAFPSVGVAA